MQSMHLRNAPGPPGSHCSGTIFHGRCRRIERMSRLASTVRSVMQAKLAQRSGGTIVARRYEELKQPRFSIAFVDGVQEIQIRAVRNWFAIPFLSIWLTAWTIAGGAAITQLFRSFQPFFLIWLCFWAVAWLFAAASLVWQLAGRETLRIVQGDLEIGHHALGYSMRRLYRGSEIHHLSASQMDFFRRFQFGIPWFPWGRSGAINFSYGARTVYAASGLDSAEGQMIVEHLRKQLPPSAV